jgi:hypothetical protein
LLRPAAERLGAAARPRARFTAVADVERFSIGALLIAAVVGLLFGLPHAMAPRFLADPDAYTPLVVSDVSFVTIDETYSHASRLREVYDGRLIPTDAGLAEHKAKPVAYYPLEVTAVGLLGRLAGVPISAAYVLADFLLPPLDFLLLFLLFRRLTQHGLFSAFAALLLLAGGAQNVVMFLARVVVAAVHGPGALPAVVRPLEFSRFPVPEATFLLLAAALYAAVRAVEASRRWPWTLVAGTAFGLLVSSYIYYWMFVTAGVGLAIAAFAVRGRTREARSLMSIVAVAAAVSLPYWVSFFRFRALAEAPDVLARVGLEHAAGAAMPSPRLLVLTLLAAAVAWASRRAAHVVVVACALGIPVIQNAHLLTGVMIQTVHWNYRIVHVWETVLATVVVGAGLMLGSDAAPSDVARRVLRRGLASASAVGLALTLVFLLGYQWLLVARTAPAYRLPAGYAQAFHWIDASTPRDSVVMSASFETSMLLPVHTHASGYLAHGVVSLASTAELVDRLLLAYRLFGIDRAYLADSFDGEAARAAAFARNRNRFSAAQPDLLEKNVRWFVFHEQRPPADVRDRLLARLDATAVTPETLGRYRLDYVLEGPLERAKGGGGVEESPYLSLAYDSAGVRIFRVHPTR